MREFFYNLRNSEFFRNKKNLIILAVLLLALPVGIFLITQQQIFKSKASVLPIVFTGANVEQRQDGSWVARAPQIILKLTSSLGSGGSPTPTSSPTATTCGTVVLSLNPSTGNLSLNQNNEIDVKLLPGGCDITAVEFGLNYVSTTLNVVSISPGSTAFGMIEAGDSSEGGKHYIFTRTPGSTLPREVVIGKIIFKPTASAAASKGVFVNIVGVAGSDGSPTITVSGQGNLPVTQKTVTSGTYSFVSQ